MAVPPRPTRFVDIPDELVAGIYERRVIPFVGAGFSNGLGMPDWETLLSRLAHEVAPEMEFHEIKTLANGDYLQIAEFLYIRSDKRIGPLRHVIEGLLGGASDPVLSTGHVELVNLGAPQIYTTNYDDLIERAYRALGVPSSVIALPKDVANSSNDTAQIVKYHGDLRHEGTLVLTESAYYKRLDLESPMDLKFRSDILGRSVLFMGYSFRDVNIRLIWFKLMQMMQDIPPDDRRASYIVKVGPNPVQDALFRDVGLKPITLDPNGEYEDADRTKLLAEFLERLALRAGLNTIPGTSDPMFVSSNLLDSISARTDVVDRYGRTALGPGGAQASSRFLERRIPALLETRGREAFEIVLASRLLSDKSLPGLFEKISLFGKSTSLTEWFCGVLRGGSSENHSLRDLLVSSSITPWETLWGANVSLEFAKSMISALRDEIHFHETGNADPDIGYVSYVVRQIINGLSPDEDELYESARIEVTRAAKIYPSIQRAVPNRLTAPDLAKALKEISAKQAQIESMSEDERLKARRDALERRYDLRLAEDAREGHN